MCKPVLVSPGMTCHFFDQANYPIYQQHPTQIQNKQHGYNYVNGPEKTGHVCTKLESFLLLDYQKNAEEDNWSWSFLQQLRPYIRTYQTHLYSQNIAEDSINNTIADIII